MILASRSPRRAELLAAAGFTFEVLSVDVDETPRTGESAREYVERLALEKARAVAAERPRDVVLGADTTVVVDGRILEKPRDAADAAAMLRALSGRAHEVLTGVAVVAPGRIRTGVESTLVWFDPLSDEDIAGYVASGEPMDKAGAYGIQGLAGAFVATLHGSYSGVMGLPLFETARLLRGFRDG